MRQGSANEADLQDVDYTASHGFIVELVNKVLFRFGSQPLIRRFLNRNQGVSGGDVYQSRLLTSGSTPKSAGKRTTKLSASAILLETPLMEDSPSLLSGFNAVLGRDSDDRNYNSQSPSSRSLSEIAALELSPDDFEAMVASTPATMVREVLYERKNEYSEYLRRLERARKDLVLRLADLDDRIMQAVAQRKDISERLEVVTDVEDDLKESVNMTELSKGPSGSDRFSASTIETTDSKTVAKATVEDISDEGDDFDSDGAMYDQSDAPRLRKLVSVCSGHYGGITAIDSDATLGLVASGSLDTQVRVWDAATGKCEHIITGHNDIIRQVQFHDRFLLTASNDGRIRMWDLSLLDSVKPNESTMVMREEYVVSSRPSSRISRTEYEEDDRDSDSDQQPDHDSSRIKMTLQSSTPPMTPSIYRRILPIEMCCENTFLGHDDAITCFEARGNTLVSGSADKTVREWDLTSGAMRQTIDITWAARDAQSLRLSGKQSNIASGSRPLSWNLQQQEQQYIWGVSANGRTGLSRSPLPFDADIELTSRRGTDNGDGGFIGALQFYEFALATGSADGCLRLWDLRTAQAHRQMHGHSQPITSLHFDDRSVVTGSLDGMAIVWDLRTGNVLQKLNFDNAVTSVQLQQCGNSRSSYAMECWIAARDPSLYHYVVNSMQRVAYKSDYGLVNSSWSRAQIAERASGQSPITRIRCQDEGVLLSGDADGIVKVWNI
ncbi:WD40 repeat-like protein [Coemansia reversa NRRL 1564]|uniref:WD40 repeat-like protein n=1 Tax=Coemansia reversa (strain ATCC 12441 / NRRL 1564) TaxID=763665 RepID=A0A2G5B7U9_COERN|nr:WD40 repeat-like protein [Coemansia reversa NRRL 1564]|eukprot:PIA15070.1 WD40 repeat-like protein [Coemansia reversa NRRL 1564]